MADNENIVIGVKIETGEAAKSLKQLKTEYKDQQKALEGLTVGTAEYVNQLKKLGATKDDIGDLNTTIKSFSPEGKVQAFTTVIGGVASGFQAATSAAALFGDSGKAIQETLLKVQAASGFAEGIKGIAGLKDGFKDLGLVLKANPIMLIASILITLGVILYELKDKVKVIGLVFKNIGDTIGFVIDKIKAFTDWVGISTFAADKANQSIIDNAKKANEAITARYDSEIAAAQRSHKETVFLEIEKSKAILKSNQLAIDAINRRRLANGTLNEEDAKALLELQKQNSEAYKNINDSWAKYKDAEIEKGKKALEEHKKREAERIKASGEAWLKEIAAKELAQANADLIAEQAAEQESLRIKTSGEEWMAELEKKQQAEDEEQLRQEQIAKNNEKLAEQEKALIELKYKLTLDSLQSIQSLTDIAFGEKLAGVKKGSKEEETILRKQFEVNKALQLSMTAVTGIQNGIAAYGAGLKAASAGGITAVAAPIWGAAYAAISAVGTLAALAKIKNTQFGSTSTPAASGGGSVGAGSQGATINAPLTASTMINADGTVKQQPPSQKVYVVESEISTKQKTVATIEENAKV